MIGGFVGCEVACSFVRKLFLINVCIGQIRTLFLELRVLTGPCFPTLYLGERKKIVSVSFFVSIPEKRRRRFIEKHG